MALVGLSHILTSEEAKREPDKNNDEGFIVKFFRLPSPVGMAAEVGGHRPAGRSVGEVGL